LVADGFSEAVDLIAGGNLEKELRQTAERARSAGRTGKKLFHSGRGRFRYGVLIRGQTPTVFPVPL
jgi:hypothetical protein